MRGCLFLLLLPNLINFMALSSKVFQPSALPLTSWRVAERVAAFSRSCSSLQCLAPSANRLRFSLAAAACCLRLALSCR